VTFRVRLEKLRVGPNVPAGCNPLVVMSLVYAMRASNEDPPPVHVAGDGDGYRVVDGRHRFIAAIIAGRSDLLCTDEAVPSEPGG
jgi:ParB-like chromosome segregation protein Spo0J